MEEKLIARIKLIVSRKPQATAEYIHTQICCFGGDTTAELMSYYGERLENEVHRLLPSAIPNH